MQWPEVVHLGEIQSRLIHDQFPVERAMSVTSELGQLQLGGRYRLERADGVLFFYAQGGGMFVTSDK